MIYYILETHCLHILDSYKVRKHDMQPFLEEMKTTHGDETVVFERSIYSLKMEWAVHNFLYRIGLFRSQTKYCDLDNPCDMPELVYKVLGTLVWIFIK